MNQKHLFLQLFLITPLFLTGCIGSIIGGHTRNVDADFPDIRTVPEREEACKDRGLHEEEEKTARAADLKNLEQEREKIKARDQALRERTAQEAEQNGEE